MKDRRAERFSEPLVIHHIGTWLWFSIEMMLIAAQMLTAEVGMTSVTTLIGRNPEIIFSIHIKVWAFLNGTHFVIHLFALGDIICVLIAIIR